MSARKGIGGIGLLKAVENADHFLHNVILRWLSGHCALAKEIFVIRREDATEFLARFEAQGIEPIDADDFGKLLQFVLPLNRGAR